MNGKQLITTFLWFDGNAEEAAKHYVSIFKNSRITSVVRTPQGAPGPANSVLTVAFELNGQEFVALNGGPQFKFTEAISLVVNCDSQEEVDTYWSRLTEGGEESRCGWLKDKFGVSWQVVPRRMIEMMGDKDPKKASAVTQAMMQMDKLDLPRLEQAYKAA